MRRCTQAQPPAHASVLKYLGASESLMASFSLPDGDSPSGWTCCQLSGKPRYTIVPASLAYHLQGEVAIKFVKLSPLRHPSVDYDISTRHKGRRLRTQQQQRTVKLFRLSGTVHHGFSAQTPDKFLVCIQRDVRERPRGYTVHANVPPGQSGRTMNG